MNRDEAFGYLTRNGWKRVEGTEWNWMSPNGGLVAGEVAAVREQQLSDLKEDFERRFKNG